MEWHTLAAVTHEQEADVSTNVGNVWWEHRRHQLADGRWAPGVHLCAERPQGLEVARLLPDSDITFETEDEARAYSEGLAEKWIANIRGT